MEYTISKGELRQLLIDAVNVGRLDMLIQLGQVKSKISQRQAYKRYGEARVDTWEKRGLIKSIKNKGATSTRYYSITDLDILDRLDK